MNTRPIGIDFSKNILRLAMNSSNLEILKKELLDERKMHLSAVKSQEECEILHSKTKNQLRESLFDQLKFMEEITSIQGEYKKLSNELKLLRNTIEQTAKMDERRSRKGRGKRKL